MGTLATSSPNQPSIQVRDLSFGYSDEPVLKSVTIDLPEKGVWAFMGPSGVGKSSLVRTLAGLNNANPAFWASGEIVLDGVDILTKDDTGRLPGRVAMLPQKARLYTGTVLENVLAGLAGVEELSHAERIERARAVFANVGLFEEFESLLDEPVLSLSMGKHRMILTARLVATDPAVLFADEPLRDIAVVEERGMMELFRRIGKQRMVGIVTHNKIEAREVSDTVCFITGDQVVEVAPTQQFFDAPQTDLGREFLISGSAWPRATDMNEEDVAEEPVLDSELSILRPKHFRFPSEFRWIIPDGLAGMQKPGLLVDTAIDLEGLRHLAIKVLVTLTEAPFATSELEPYGIQSLHFPIVDMSVPSFSEAEEACGQISGLIDEAQPVVLHCKAGLGRTGLMLACVLVYRGECAMKAIERVRLVNPYYIQTEEQFDFVGRFAEHLKRKDDRPTIALYT